MAKHGLVYCGDKYHSADMVLAGLRSAGGAEFEFESAHSGGGFQIPDDLSLVVIAKLNVLSPDDDAPWTDETVDTSLRQFVQNGNALLVIHGGTVRYAPVPGIRTMTGGSFIQHPASCDVQLETSPTHPISAGIPSFAVFDEHYFMDVDPDINVFLQAHSQHGTQPAGWTKAFGKGRICVLTPGHGAAVWERSEYRELLRNALNWLTIA